MKEINLLMFILNILMVVGITFSVVITPFILRKNLFFGVHVPPEKKSHPLLISIRKSFIMKNLSVGIVLLFAAIIINFTFPNFNLIFLMYASIIQAFVMFPFYFTAWKKTLKIKKEQHWKIETKVYIDTKLSAKQEKKNFVGWVWYVISFLISIFVIVFSLYYYPNIPNQIIISWGIDGTINGITDKSIWSVIMMPLMGLASSFVMWLSGYFYVKAKLSVDTQNVSASFKQKEKFRKIWQNFAGYMSVLTVMLMCFMQPFSLSLWKYNNTIFIVVIIVFMIFTLVPAISLPLYTGQSGCKLKVEGDNDSLKSESGLDKKSFFSSDDDHLWKLGMFYYNPNDPSIFIESRFGTNIDFNYAKIGVRIFATITALIIIVSYVVLTIIMARNGFNLM